MECNISEQTDETISIERKPNASKSDFMVLRFKHKLTARWNKKNVLPVEENNNVVI